MILVVAELLRPNCVCAFRNGYSMFCAELMSSMKDVPSTERMVMCSQRWKLLKQNEKDAYQKRCEQVSSESSRSILERRSISLILTCSSVFFQRKKDYEIDMNRFLSVSLTFYLSCIFRSLSFFDSYSLCFTFLL